MLASCVWRASWLFTGEKQGELDLVQAVSSALHVFTSGYRYFHLELKFDT